MRTRLPDFAAAFGAALEAAAFFAAHPSIHHALRLLQDVGLGYLNLGQQSPTLSGGEAQRIKLVTELAKARMTEGVFKTGRASRTPHTLYVLDEPTVGLSMADVEKLIHVLHRLVDAGNTVVVIEHNLEVIKTADWVLDLGPEGGDGGGELVASGTPEAIVREKRSYTGQFLKELLERRPKSDERFARQAKSRGRGLPTERTPEARARGNREAAE